MGKMESERKVVPQTPCYPAGDALFASAHGALKFAMNYVHGTLKKGFLATAAGVSSGGRGLGGLDGAAQAGMIQAHVLNLAPHRRALIYGRFMAPSSPCECKSQCCRGYRESPDWKLSVEQLTEYVLKQGLTGTISHYRLRRSLIVRYFGVRASFVEIADQCGVHRTTASQYNKAMVEHLKAEEHQAFQQIEEILRDAGIVGEMPLT
jgi:hypothetical protein